MQAELTPVVDAVLRDVRDDVERDVAAAVADASALLAEAGEEAEAILARARADGEAAAERLASAALAAARREGHEAVLGAQRRVYEAVRRGAHEALVQAAGSAGVDALLARLEGLARARLGPGADVRRLGGERVGICATAGTRAIELTVDELIEREVAQLADRVENLWR